MMGRREKMALRKQGALPLVTALLLIAAISRGQAENVYQLSGTDYTLEVNYRGDFKEITWLLNNDQLVELELDDTKQPIWYQTYPQLKAGASLNNETGTLTIPRLTRSDTGNYRAEVKLYDLTDIYTDITLIVLDPVSKPNITIHTIGEKCILSCESATSGVSYEWQNDEGNILSDEETFTVRKPTELLRLTCIVSNHVSEEKAFVTIKPSDPVSKPTFTIQTTGEKCILSCERTTPGVRYEWHVDDHEGFFYIKETFDICKPTELLKLTCIVSNPVSKEKTSVTIKPTGLAENVYQLSGSDVTLKPTYREDFKEITWLLNRNKLVELDLNEKKEPVWFRNFPQLKAGASLNNQTGDLTIPQLTISDSGNYRAEVKLHDLTYHYTDITLTVLDPVSKPTITTQTTEEEYILSCASATPDVSYEWQKDEKKVSNEATFTIRKPTETEVKLTCIVSNPVSEGNTSVTIQPGQVPNLYQRSGTDYTLDLEDYLAIFLEITWVFNNDKLVELDLEEQVLYQTFPQMRDRASLNNQTGDLTISRLTIRDSGDYRAEVKLHDLTYIYTSITLIVLDPVETPIITILTSEDWIHLSCESATPGVSYEWQDDKGNIVSNEKTYIIHTPTEAAVTLTCIASNAVSEERASVTFVPPDRLSGGAIAGIIAGIIVLIICIFEYIRRKYRNHPRMKAINKRIPPFPYINWIRRIVNWIRGGQHSSNHRIIRRSESFDVLNGNLSTKKSMENIGEVEI